MKTTETNYSDLFKGTAYYYARFRSNIPQSVIKYLEKRFNLDGNGILLDIGCGTGQLTYPLANKFENVIAVDPDEEMLNEAKHLNNYSKYKHIKNIKWRKEDANHISGSNNKYKLVTFCRAFHWVEQYTVLEKLKKLLTDGGGVAIIGDGSFWTGTEDWQLSVKQVVKNYLGEQRRAGSGKFNTTDEPYEDILRKSGFVNIECINFAIERKWTFESIKGWLYSSSFASRRLFGKKYKDFEVDLKKALLELNKDGVYIEHASFSVKSGFYNNKK
jgi:ubiquinone/menaquinone biosynthesis C-methylase UbiE